MHTRAYPVLMYVRAVFNYCIRIYADFHVYCYVCICAAVYMFVCVLLLLIRS